MKAKINHNLSDEEFEDVVKALYRDIEKKTLKKVRLPAANPAQAKMSKNFFKLYKEIMVDSLSKKLAQVLKKELDILRPLKRADS